ncbi:hypothetical protein J1N35_028924 [Gossypium stocksii]|uniref:Stomatal closure-related actin-binding protein coiled-coil domain-containing protein n=1 Tax=Gossypium stocksii TaxID=47602 RepID=A0A9D3ZSV9_9ROSI|nr:hypothetical protein J1N35_028924 [Gossypium stocksii]
MKLNPFKEQVPSSVTGQGAKLVTIAQNTSHGDLLVRWGLVDPQELTRFKELMKKLIYLKPGWPNEADIEIMNTKVRAFTQTLLKSTRDVRETLDVVKGRTEDLKELLKDFVIKSFSSNVEKLQKLLNSIRNKLTERNDAFEAMVMALKEEKMITMRALSTRIEEFNGELVLCRETMDRGVLSATLNCEVDVLKPKEFVGRRSAYDMDNFLWRMEQYFYAKGIMDDANFVIKLGLGKDKLESSEFKKRAYVGGTMRKIVAMATTMMVVELSKKVFLRRDDGSNNAPKKLGLSARGVEATNGLPPKEEVSYASNLEEIVVMQMLKLGPIKLNSGKATELAELLERLPPKEEVSCASDFEEKIWMQILKLGSIRLISVESSEELPLKGEGVIRIASIGDLANKIEKGLAIAVKLLEEARLREVTSLEKHVYLKKLRNALKSLKGCVDGRNKDDVEEDIAMVEALAVQLTQRREFIQAKAKVKKLATFLKQTLEDTKKLVDEERNFASAEIRNARATT